MAPSGQILALVCLGLTLLAVEVTSQRRCSVPSWDSSLGPNPVATNRGKVVVVALFAGYCSYCVRQAGRLDRLRQHLITQGLTDISMVMINSGLELSRQNIANLQNAASIPVIQDTEDETMFNEIFRGSKDDFIVYDRCGQRVAFIPHPYSNLAHTITERVIRAVYNGRYRVCPCNIGTTNRDPHDVMYGDQPMGPSYGVVQTSDTRLDLDCVAGDRWCRRFQRNFRRNHWDRSGRNQNSMHASRMSNRPRVRIHQQQREDGEDEGHHGYHSGRDQGGYRGRMGHRGYGAHMGHRRNRGRYGANFGGPM